MPWEGSPALLAKVAPPLSSAVLAMAADPAVGLIGLTSGWRSYDQQIAARKANGCPDIHKSPASSCRVPTARPGQSNHEAMLKDGTPYALAVDLHGDLAGAARVMGKYNLHRPVKGESWHFELTSTAAVATAVRSGGKYTGSASTLDVPNVGKVTVSNISDKAPAAKAVGFYEKLNDGSVWMRAGLWAGGIVLGVLGLVVILNDSTGGAPVVTAAATAAVDPEMLLA